MIVRSLVLAAGVSARVPGGNFFMLIDTSSPLNVQLVFNASNVETAESVEAGYKAFGERANGQYFDYVKITSESAQTIKYGVSLGSGGYDRALGEVTSEPKLTQSLADPVGHDALTANNFCYMGIVAQPGVAAEYAHAQLLNPAGSARVVYVDKIRVAAAAAGTLDLMKYHTALATVVANAAQNKNVDGTVGLAQPRTQSSATLLGTAPHLIEIQVQANDTAIIDLVPPIKLDAGEGVLLRLGAVNTTIYANYEWREYA